MRNRRRAGAISTARIGARSVGGRALIAAIGIALCGAGTSSRTYRNETLRVRGFEPPPGWVLAPQSSYPRLLASYSHREGGRLTLSGQRTAAGATARSIAQSSLTALERQGFTSIELTADGARARLSASLDGGKRFVRQLYVAEGGFGYVVTLLAPQASAAIMERDFEEAVRSLELGGGGDALVR